MNESENKDIMARNIQYYMDINNKTRSDICEILGIKYTTFTDWVKGNAYPRIDKIELMANYFGIKKSDLVENRDKSGISNDPNFMPLSNDNVKMIPLVGTIRCGEPIYAEQNIHEYIPTYSEGLLKDYEYFWLNAIGDSMINAGINAGDRVLVKKQSDVESGDIAVVAINDDTATLKRVIKKENALIIQPENPKYEIKILVGKEMESVSIWGKAVRVEKTL